MKNLLTILLTFLALSMFADIPRVDIMEVEYQGVKYYKWEFISHLTFTEGCVFDRYTEEYLYEEEAYFSNGYNGNKFYREMVSIPKSKIWSEYDSTNSYTSNYLVQLVGDRIELAGKQLDSINIIKIHIGNTAGYTYTNSLSKSDENWIQDYELERIVKFNDGELCDIDLFGIKGNISKAEAKSIKNEIKSLYKAVLSNNRYDYAGKRPEQYFDELLKRNILMIGFCSC